MSRPAEVPHSQCGVGRCAGRAPTGGSGKGTRRGEHECSAPQRVAGEAQANGLEVVNGAWWSSETEVTARGAFIGSDTMIHTDIPSVECPPRTPSPALSRGMSCPLEKPDRTMEGRAKHLHNRQDMMTPPSTPLRVVWTLAPHTLLLPGCVAALAGIAPRCPPGWSI